MNTLRVYDPAMCCSSGVCGPDVNPELAQFAGALQALEKGSDVSIERYNLAQQPQAFVSNGEVKALLAQRGSEVLPLIYLNAELRFTGRYPSRTELFHALGLVDAKDVKEEVGPCCSGGNCG